MATGDLKNNLRKLKTELRLVNYADAIAWDQINIGLTEPLLPILHYLLADYSCELSGYFCAKGFELYGKSDLRFIEIVYKILIKEFNVKPMLTKQQFFSVGFTEIKVIFVTKIINLCRNKCAYISSRLKKKKIKPLKKVIPSQPAKVTNELHDSANIDFRVDVTDVQETIPQKLPIQLANTKTQTKDDESVRVIDVLDITEINDSDDDDSDFIAVGSDTDDIENNGNESSVLKHGVKAVGQENWFRSQGQRYEKNVLDITEIEDDDDFDVSCEVINEDTPPKIQVTKHLPEHKLFIGSGNAHPGFNVATDNQVKECQGCSSHKKELENVHQRMSELEKKFTDMMRMNSELSAKVILLETKVKFLESDSSSKMNKKGTVKSDNELFSDNEEEKEEKREEHVYQNEEKKSYSPLKYSDDEIIIKDFKPVTMRDVQKAHMTTVYQNKENTKPIPEEITKSQPDYGAMSPFDVKTSEQIQNVQKRFQYAERLLNQQRKNVFES